MRTALLASLVCVALVWAQTEDDEPPQQIDFAELRSDEYIGSTRIVTDEEPWDSNIEIVARGSTETNVVPEIVPECEENPHSKECIAARTAADRAVPRLEKPLDPIDHKNQTDADMATYADLIAAFEQLSNDWGCASTGHALYTVAGDGDVMHYIYQVLSQAFMQHGQHYGAQLVVQFHADRATEKGLYSCGAVNAKGTAKLYGAPIDALLTYKEGIEAWLKKNEVDPSPVLGSIMPELRSVYSRWIRGRLIFGMSTDERKGATFGASAAAIEAILPLTHADSDPANECEAAGDLYVATASNAMPGKVQVEIDAMLERCVANGRLSANPVPFGDALSKVGRTKEARAMYELAVQRGVLCHAMQRPEAYHRKDLAPFAIWPLTDFKALVAETETLRKAVAPAVQANKVAWSGNQEMSTIFLSRGSWERTQIYSRSAWNDTVCDSLGNAGCDEIEKALERILIANDGYQFHCNGSTLIELWRLRHDTKTETSVGSTNIVAQALLPVGGKGSLRLRVGDETAMVDADDKDFLVYDDTFENSLEVTGADSGDLVLLHLQLCHPELHELAMDLPSNQCVDME